MIRNEAELNGIPSNVEDLWIANFEIANQKNLILNQQQFMKNLTIGMNALSGITSMELSGLKSLERVVIMRGGMYDGSGRLRVVNCTNLKSIITDAQAIIRYKYLELIELPHLQSLKLGDNAFKNVYTIQMESNKKIKLHNRLDITTIHSTRKECT